MKSAAAVLTCVLSLASLTQTPARYEVHAVRFAHVSYALSSLVAGAERGPQVDLAFTVWVARDRANGRVVLVDSGFYRDKFIQRWRPQDFVRPDAALMTGLGIPADAVTDIVVTHSHWDHAGGVDLFPRANVWIQREEFQHYVGPGGEVLRGVIDPDDAKVFAALNATGRLKLVEGDDREILPGIRVYTGGKHTYASQYVGVATRAGVVVLASDNAYLYMNLKEKRAIAQTLDPAANLAAQARMLQFAARPALVIPGHDPAVFDRFPAVKPGVVRID